MRLSVIVAVLAAVVLSSHAAEKVSYKGYKVYRINALTVEQAKSLEIFQKLGYDFWSEIRVGRPVDIMVPPQSFGFAQVLDEMKLDYHVMIEDVQELIDLSYSDVADGYFNPKASFDHTRYHPLQDMYDFFDALAAENPTDISTKIIGQTYESRDMKVIQICKGGCGEKPAMYIEAGIHAREWIAPAVAVYIVDQLVNEPANVELIDKLDWYILPSANPDGYAYSRDSDRLWRKTRKPNEDSLCIGTDANRNFEAGWGLPGASNFPCDQAYRGTEVWSEVEARNIRDFVLSIPNLQFVHDMHSYSQLVLLPFGYTPDVPSDYDEILGDATQANAALQAVHGKIYTVGNTYDTIYPASGIVVDWGYEYAKAKWSVSMELRDTGLHGFLLPEDQIIPCGEEVFAFHADLARTIISKVSPM